MSAGDSYVFGVSIQELVPGREFNNYQRISDCNVGEHTSSLRSFQQWLEPFNYGSEGLGFEPLRARRVLSKSKAAI